jgi:hypothetical protein
VWTCCIIISDESEKTVGRKQNAEGRKIESSRQDAVCTRQKTESSRQKAESRIQNRRGLLLTAFCLVPSDHFDISQGDSLRRELN